jgi:hypothetical protein
LAQETSSLNGSNGSFLDQLVSVLSTFHATVRS